MRGTGRGTPEQQLMTGPDSELMQTLHVMPGRDSPTPSEESFPDVMTELERRIQELGERMQIRNTHRRVKFIAARLAEILPAIQDCIRDSSTHLICDRASVEPGVQTALLWHEALMADMLRKMGTQEEASSTESLGMNDPCHLQGLITELVVQWEEVRAAMGRADHPASLENPPDRVITPLAPP